MLLRSIQFNQYAKGHRIVRPSYVRVEIETQWLFSTKARKRDACRAHNYVQL